MKQKLGFFGKAVIFLVLFALIMAPIQTLLSRKSLEKPWDMTNKIGGFYNEPENEFSVMFFGSSHAYASFSPLRLWEDTGVKSYVFATQQQPLWATYAYLKQALKTQAPQLVVVECNMAMGDADYYDEGVTYSYMDDLAMSWDKVRLAWVSAPDVSGRVELLCNLIKYHGRWSELTQQDWDYDAAALRDPYKGYVMLSPQSTVQPGPEMGGVTEQTPLTEKNAVWLEKIIQLCKEEGADLWLVKAPSNVSAAEKQLLNTVAAIAEEHGVLFTDFNEDYAAMGLSGDVFYDAHHLDANGSVLFTDYFAARLMEQYPDLPTAESDPVWVEDLAVYQAELAQYAP